MSIGLLFWVLMIMAMAFWLWGSPWGDSRPFGISLFVFVLIFLLGWAEFGFVIHR